MRYETKEPALSPHPALDDFADSHLIRWVRAHIVENEQAPTYFTIRAFLREYPDILERGDSWPEIRNLAERFREAFNNSRKG